MRRRAMAEAAAAEALNNLGVLASSQGEGGKAREYYEVTVLA